MRVVQHPRGPTASESVIVGGQSQLRYDTDLNQYRLHDGVTPGGWLIPKVADLPLLTSKLFVAVNTKSVPATPLALADVGDLNEFTVAGAYTMMAAATAGLGVPVLLRPTVAGVSVVRLGADLFYDQGAAGATSLNLVQYETVTIAMVAANSWRVMNRY